MPSNPNKPLVKIENLHHREADCLAIRFPYNEDLIAEVKKIKGATFSKTHKCWYVRERKNLLQEIMNMLEDKAFIDYSTMTGSSKAAEETPTPAKSFDDTEERHILRMMEQKLHLKRYSTTTTKTYLDQFRLFLQFYRPANPTDLSELEIRNYLLYIVEKKKLGRSSQNQAINAIKFFYEVVLNQEKKVYYLERPIKERTLPTILSEDEVLDIFASEMNPKHRLMLMLIYCGGLRRSELLNLRKGDVDTKRGVIVVKGGKGKKDRQTLLAQSVIPLVEEYLKRAKPARWLFEGLDKKQYSSSSLQAIFKRAVKKAGINKEVHLHTLRHSFATHLLESGTSTRYIQELLGHESPMTTELYTQVTRFSLQKLKSPLDKIVDQKRLDEGKE